MSDLNHHTFTLTAPLPALASIDYLDSIVILVIETKRGLDSTAHTP